MSHLPNFSPLNDQAVALKGHSSSVLSVAFSPSGQLLASGGNDNTIHLWNPKSGAQVATLRSHSASVDSIAFSPDGTTLASGSWDTTIKLWDVRSRAEIATLMGHLGEIECVAFSPDGARLVSGSNDKTIWLWDVKSRASIRVLRGHSGRVWSVAFAPDGERIASGSDDTTIILWNGALGTSVTTLGTVVRSVAFSPSGEYLASGSDDNTIRLWNMAGALISTFEGHSGRVKSVSFSPNGKYLASGSYGGADSVRLWDVASRSRVPTPQSHSGYVYSVTFSPDGARLAFGSDDMILWSWPIPPENDEGSKDAAVGTGLIDLAQTATSVPTSRKDGNLLRQRLHPDDLNDLDQPNFPANTDQDFGGTGSISQQGTVASTSSSVTQTNEDSLSPSVTQILHQYQYETDDSPALSIPVSNDITGLVSLESGTLIAYGGFGDLFLGVHNDRGKVALKKPRRLLDEALIRRFLREVDLWCSVSHRYVLPCLGMCRVGPDVYVVSPFIENGDLLSCMNRGMSLNRSKLLYEVTEALTHLHHRGIVHGDVKAQNILLSDDGSALLCDFGLAKAFDTMATSTEVKGTGSIRWMAPELFKNGSRSMASDVYSLGITIAEVLSGQTPFKEIPDNIAVMFHIVYENGKPSKTPLESPEGKSYSIVWETAEKCWVTKAEDRPHMAQVLGMLFPLTREKN